MKSYELLLVQYVEDWFTKHDTMLESKFNSFRNLALKDYKAQK